MITPSNIDIFNETVGKALVFLYENFPRKILLNVSKLTDTPTPSMEEGKEELNEKMLALEMRYYSIEWLIDAGYIAAKPFPYEAFSNAVLTAKGLEVLKFEPKALKAPFGNKLLEASQSGASEVLKNTTSSLLTAGTTFAIKHFLHI